MDFYLAMHQSYVFELLDSKRIHVKNNKDEQDVYNFIFQSCDMNFSKSQKI